MYTQWMKKIMLTQNKFALVDDDDHETLSKHKWHFADCGNTGYAKRYNPTRKPTLLRMHNVILPLLEGYMCDHINGNGLDNRKSNLRLVTKSQNMMNRGLQKNSISGYVGVSKHKQGKWRAYIKVNRKQIHIGMFTDKKEAAKAYNEAAKHYHGEFAKLNIIC